MGCKIVYKWKQKKSFSSRTSFWFERHFDAKKSLKIESLLFTVVLRALDHNNAKMLLHLYHSLSQQKPNFEVNPKDEYTDIKFQIYFII